MNLPKGQNRSGREVVVSCPVEAAAATGKNVFTEENVISIRSTEQFSTGWPKYTLIEKKMESLSFKVKYFAFIVYIYNKVVLKVLYFVPMLFI